MNPFFSIIVAKNFWPRFKGLMLSRPLPENQAFLIPRCASIHTFFMRYALDLAYLDKQGRIVKIVKSIKPWRLSWGGAGAVHALEFTAGGIDKHGIQIGDAMLKNIDREIMYFSHRRNTKLHSSASNRLQRGAAMVEFVIVGPIITVIGLGILQYGMLFFAKNQINHAAFMAARAGTTQHAYIGNIQAAYKRALIPLYGGGRTTAELAVAAAKVNADMTPQTYRIEILNPTKESFTDYADPALSDQYQGRRAIPNTGLGHKTAAQLNNINPNSGQTIQDANLLKIRITHGYQPKVWLMGMIYKKYLQWLDTGEDDFKTQLIENGRIPVVSHITLAMQSDAVEQIDDPDLFVSNPGMGNSGYSSDPGDSPLTDKERPYCLTMGCSVLYPPADPGAGGGAGSGNSGAETGNGNSEGGNQSAGGSCMSGTLSSDLLFAFDQSTLTDAGKAELDKLAASLKDKSYSQITLTGYTDQLGTDSHNQALSLARANAAKDYLVSQGISASAIKTQGLGSANPKVPLSGCPAGGDQISCLAPNRRVTYDVA